jgi:PAS domain S-box-containing protein
MRLFAGRNVSVAQGAVVAICVLAIVALWAGMLIELDLYRSRTIARELRQNDNLARVLAVEVTRTMRAAEITLDEMAAEYRRLGAEFHLVDYAKRRNLERDQVNALSVIDQNGDMVLVSIPGAPAFNFSDRPLHREHSQNAGSEMLISPPTLGTVTGKWTIYLSRRLDRPDGSFGGSVAYGLDAGHMASIFRTLNLGQDSNVALIGRDGIIRARETPGNPNPGQNVADGPMFTEDLQRSSSGNFIRRARRDGVVRLSSYVALDAYPLIVLVGTSMDSVLEGFRSDRVKYVSVGAIATAVVLLFGLFSLRLIRRFEKLNEARLENEERYALVETAVHDGVFDWDLLSGRTYFSPQLKSLLGYEHDQLGDRVSVYDYLHPDDHARAREELTAHFKTGKPYGSILRLRHKGGEYLWFQVKGAALRNTGGRAHRMIGSISDITEKKMIEDKLAETEARVSSMIDSAMDAIVTVDDTMRIVAFNLSATRLFRCAASEAIGRPLDRFIPTRYRAAHAGQMRDFARSGLTMRIMGQGAEVRGLRADGEEFPVEISISSHKGHGKQFYSAIVRDITERKRSEALVKQGLIELGEAKEAAEMANRAKSAFLANMSHELRTPLNAIIGFSEITAKGVAGPVPKKYADYAGDILTSGRHLLSVINDILDMSKIEAGHYQLEMRRLDLAKAIDAALGIAGGIAKDRGVSVETSVDRDLPPIEGDERAIKQVLLNLFSNAVKFNKSNGRISVALRALPEGWQEIKIADTGIGIAPESLAKLFQPFQQAGDQYTRRGEGTGLGLWISLQFVKLHGGTLHLESQPGAGTTAVLRLPVKRPGGGHVEKSAAGREPAQ